MEPVLHIPDDMAKHLGTAGELERRDLEAFALEEFRLGRLTRPELRRLLGLGRIELDQFLRAHDFSGSYTEADLARDWEDLERL